MTKVQNPLMYVFAGNNGSGKSTFRSLVIDKLGIEINIDPDAIARRLNPENPELKRLAAGKLVIKTVRECIKEEKSFSIETTLAGKNAINQMNQAKENGYEIIMFFLGLKEVSKNIERVALRVKNGGHHIPTEDILRRHTKSRDNLLQNLDLIDNLLVVDNSNLDGELILETSQGNISFQSNHIPQWVTPIIEKLQE
ncbi:zeta toxin family protein [Paenisporosarcina macmurdoensis]|uniref:UDP-N-acetylglucosamine kinase n=1 Tax=Paenisporosarcina macmurdoensis TaxID=212659 RepID=A0ABW1L5Q0_9BACL